MEGRYGNRARARLCGVSKHRVFKADGIAQGSQIQGTQDKNRDRALTVSCSAVQAKRNLQKKKRKWVWSRVGVSRREQVGTGTHHGS